MPCLADLKTERTEPLRFQGFTEKVSEAELSLG
jgi:hypothetical protein